MKKGVSKHRVKNIIFICAASLAIIINLLTPGLLHLHYAATTIWCGIIICWMFSIRKRILNRSIFSWLYAGGYMMLLLFASRVAKYVFSDYIQTITRYLWYFYYVPLIGMSLCFFCAALSVGRRSSSKTGLKVLISIAGAVLSALILMNDLHGWMFRFKDAERIKYSLGPLLIIVLVSVSALLIAGFIMLLVKCRVSDCRRYFFIPLICGIMGLILVGIYLANGSSSPKLFGLSLYNIQEVWAFTFISIFESYIIIGLIPSNTGYEEIYEHSNLLIGISDEAGKIVLSTKDMVKVSEKELLDAAGSDAPVGFSKDRLLDVRDIHGGYSVHLIDISAINEINEGLQEALSELENENAVKKMSLDIEAKLAGLEERNRIFEEISKANTELIEEIENHVREGGKRGIFKALLLGTYLKRRVNIELAEREDDKLDITELYIAAGEISSALSAGGINACANMDSKADFPAHGLLLLLDNMMEIIKETLDDLTVVYINVFCIPEKSYGIKMLLGTNEKTASEILEKREEFAERFGSLTEIESDEGDLTISMEYSAEGGKL